MISDREAFLQELLDQHIIGARPDERPQLGKTSEMVDGHGIGGLSTPDSMIRYPGGNETFSRAVTDDSIEIETEKIVVLCEGIRVKERIGVHQRYDETAI